MPNFSILPLTVIVPALLPLFIVVQPESAATNRDRIKIFFICINLFSIVMKLPDLFIPLCGLKNHSGFMIVKM
ncbi:hypothetical protein D3C85_1559870 [compost metagenome]